MSWQKYVFVILLSILTHILRTASQLVVVVLVLVVEIRDQFIQAV